MRIRVTDVLDLLAAGLTPGEVLAELPDLEDDDVRACLRYASRRRAIRCLLPDPEETTWKSGLTHLRSQAPPASDTDGDGSNDREAPFPTYQHFTKDDFAP